MADVSILTELGIVVVGAGALLFAARLLRLPPILAYMVAGLAVGPVSGLFPVSPSLELFSEIGISLLLFLVGLELSVARIRDIGRSALVVGTVQVAATFAGGALIASALGFAVRDALVLGLAVAFSSTVVVVKLLDRTGGLRESHGRLSIGVLLVQDVLVALVLTVVSGLEVAGADPGRTGVAVDLLRTFGGLALLVGFAALSLRGVLPSVVRWLARSGEALFIVSLAWCFGFIVAAEGAHVSPELGAFVAGVTLAQCRESRVLRRLVHPLVNLFVAVFFVSLGAALDLRGVAAEWPAVLALSSFVVVAKPAAVTWLARHRGHAPRTALLAGLALGQVSEFSLVLAAMTVTAGLTGAELLPVVSGAALLTIAISSLLVPVGPTVYRFLAAHAFPGGAGPSAEPAAPDEPCSGHIVIVGMNTLGRRAVAAFAERGESVVAVDTDEAKLTGLPARPVVGDVGIPAVLEEAGVPVARLVVSALQIEDVNRLLALRCRERGVPVSVHAFEPEQVEELLEVGADHLMVSKQEAARQLMAALGRVGVVA